MVQERCKSPLCHLPSANHDTLLNLLGLGFLLLGKLIHSPPRLMWTLGEDPLPFRPCFFALDPPHTPCCHYWTSSSRLVIYQRLWLLIYRLPPPLALCNLLDDITNHADGDLAILDSQILGAPFPTTSPLLYFSYPQPRPTWDLSLITTSPPDYLKHPMLSQLVLQLCGSTVPTSPAHSSQLPWSFASFQIIHSVLS